MRTLFVFILLAILKTVSRIFYRYDLGWVGEVPPRPWSGNRVVAILNHTSLYEVLWAGSPPWSFLWQVARHGVVPVADLTFTRPLVGRFFRVLARHVVSISRERDRTWQQVMARIDDPEAVILILPEGRMMRADGLDKHGKPMTVRGGIADIIEAIPEGRMLLAYSGGLHHVQIPGEGLPRLFKTLWMRFESLDIAAYREEIRTQAGAKGFKRAVVADLERRRDLHCWPEGTRRPGDEKVAATVSADGES